MEKALESDTVVIPVNKFYSYDYQVSTMKMEYPHILLLNPWIYDFAAYDFWARPIGLLYLASILKSQGYKVSYIDCLDRFHPGLPRRLPVREFGRGPYLKVPVNKPEGLRDIPRRYSRYGIPESLLRMELNRIPKAEAVLVTSLMTYWYPGVFEVIRIVRQMIKEAPIILGGIYATLCHEHALKNSGADYVISGQGERAIIALLNSLFGRQVSPLFQAECPGPAPFFPEDPDSYPYPAFELQTRIPYVPIETGRGCPFRCAYCASSVLNPKLLRRSPKNVVNEIEYWHKRYGVLDFPFYDDALLIDPEHHIVPILEDVLARGLKVRFHTPNALHIRNFSHELALLMFRAGFKTVRLGLETAVFGGDRKIDNKVDREEFEKAVRYLKEAGFSGKQIGAYLLFGLPGQDYRLLELSIRMVRSLGIQPILAQYSPIPRTPLWDEAVRVSAYDLSADPIFHNNSIFPCLEGGFSWEKISYFRGLVRN